MRKIYKLHPNYAQNYGLTNSSDKILKKINGETLILKKNKKRLIAVLLALTASSSLAFGYNFFHADSENLEQTVWNYDFTGEVEEFVAPYTGKYYIETNGAQGGGVLSKGGRATGYINLYEGDTLYITVGEAGQVSEDDGKAERTYNGGGAGYYGAGSGGGATAITTTNRGELENFEDYQDEVIMVSGGSAGKGSKSSFTSIVTTDDGVYYAMPFNVVGSASDVQIKEFLQEYVPNTGAGGGSVGISYGASKKGDTDDRYIVAQSGGVDNGYAFGKGEDGTSEYNSGYSGAGGGGWYGGGTTAIGILCGGGGSGYVNQSIVSAFSNEQNINEGNGSATIRYEGKPECKITINTDNGGTIDGESGNVIITGKVGDTITIPEVETYDGYTFKNYKDMLTDEEVEANTEITLDFSDEDIMLVAQYFYITAEMVTPTEYLFNFKDSSNEGLYYKVEKYTSDGDWLPAEMAEGTSSSREQSSDFAYEDSVVSFTAQYSGYYYLEASGASGGGGTAVINGGFASGYYYLTKGTTIYVCVGSRGSTSGYGGSRSWIAGGYNGGGKGYGNRYCGGGGGATSITTTNRGILSKYTSYQSEVILVAGAGGGGCNAQFSGKGNQYGFSGGGLAGEGDSTSWGAYCTGGTQTSAGTNAGFGYGGQTTSTSGSKDMGGGGGGWYGGTSGLGDDHGGAGGSSYIAKLKSGYTVTGGAKTLQGSAHIEYADCVTEGNSATIELTETVAPNKAINGKTETVSDGKVKVSWNEDGDNGETVQYRVISYKESDDSEVTTSDEYEFEYTSGVKDYYYYVDTNATGTVTLANSTEVEDDCVEIDQPSALSYLHVAVIDYAGNLGETYDIEIPAVMDVEGTVTWDDVDNTYNTRPDSVTLNLLKNDEIVKTITVDTTSDNVLDYKFAGVPIYADYTVSINDVISKDYPVDKYVTTQDGYDFVCYLRNNEGYSISGDIIWEDNDNKLGYRPKTVLIDVLQNGSYYIGIGCYNDKKLVENYSFSSLPKYKCDFYGNVTGLYTYSIKEEFSPMPQYINRDGKAIDAYEITYSEATLNGSEWKQDITNTFVPAENIISVKPYNNSLTVVTNIETNTEVIFRRLESTYNDDLSVSYTDDYSDIYYNVDVNNIPETISHMVAGKYEIEVLNPIYTLQSIKLTDSEYVTLVEENGKYYIIIEETNSDTYGTVTINLIPKEHIGYQSGPDIVPGPEKPDADKKTGYAINNLFKN
jgi:hypothetical protein